jgi:hypothetical protein
MQVGQNGLAGISLPQVGHWRIAVMSLLQLKFMAFLEVMDVSDINIAIDDELRTTFIQWLCLDIGRRLGKR